MGYCVPIDQWGYSIPLNFFMNVPRSRIKIHILKTSEIEGSSRCLCFKICSKYLEIKVNTKKLSSMVTVTLCHNYLHLFL